MICNSLISWYKGHSNIKWNSSSRLLQSWHFRSDLGVFSGLCHLPVSISSLWDDTLSLLNEILNFLTVIISKYVLKLKSANKLYVFALEELFKLPFQFWIKLSLSLCLKIRKKWFLFPTPWCSHTSLNPKFSSIVFTDLAHDFLFGYLKHQGH